MGFVLFRLETVHAHYDLLAPLDGLLIFVRGLLNFPLHVAGFDRAQNSSQRINPRNIFLRARFDFVR